MKILEAIDRCKMKTTQVYTLTIGKEYEIKDRYFDETEDEDVILIIDDEEDEHEFPISDINKYFKIKKHA